jgi:hypothetical protein
MASQQLQMARDLIHHTLGRRPNPENRQAAGVDLRSASILDDLCRDTQGKGLESQVHQLRLALHLHGNLGLATLFPAPEDAVLRAVGG